MIRPDIARFVRQAFVGAVLSLSVISAPASAETMPAAVTRDPPQDAAHPARMSVLHIPSGGVEINGIAYLASGAGPHPTFLFFHGLPGNEKNIDLLQAVRRAGWNAITLNYRGSWGSPGSFSFAQNLEDARAALAYLRDPAHIAELSIDTRHIVIAGHSMGGWVTANTAAVDHDIAGAILISAWDVGFFNDPMFTPDKMILDFMADDHETLSSVTPRQMADEAIAHHAEWGLILLADPLKDTRLLVLNSNDGLGPRTEALVAEIHAKGGKSVVLDSVPTDHVWSDRRLTLAAKVISWLEKLPK